MVRRKAHATWEGKLNTGKGTMALGLDGRELAFAFGSRFEQDKPQAGSNPEELIGGALAGCFSMALAHGLGEAGYTPVRIETVAHVQLAESNGGYAIPQIELATEADVPVVESEEFERIAREAKANCPVSRLLAGAEISLQATLQATQRR
jgi:osmotically inducible protein OsmC